MNTPRPPLLSESCRHVQIDSDRIRQALAEGEASKHSRRKKTPFLLALFLLIGTAFAYGHFAACVREDEAATTHRPTGLDEKVSLKDEKTLRSKWRGGNPEPILFIQGEVGFIRDPRIVQICDSENTLIEVDDHLVVLTGYNASIYVDGDTISGLVPVKVLGRMSYTTVLGAKRTTHALEYLDPNEMRDPRRMPGLR